MFTLDEAELLSLFIQSLAYGVYLVSFGYCLRALLCERDRLKLRASHRIRWWAVTVTVLMGAISTFDVAMNVRLLLEGFVWLNRSKYNSSEDLFDDNTNWLNIIGYVDYIAQTAIGDGILVFRVYLVHGKKFMIVMLPAIIYVAGITCALVILGLGLARDDLGGLDFLPLMFVSFALTVVLNVLSTSLIIIKLWRTRARVSGIAIGPDNLMVVIRIIMDSGLLYTVSVLVLIGTLPLDNVSTVVSGLIIQVIGIAFNLIIIRVHVNEERSHTQGSATLHAASNPSGSNSHKRAIAIEDSDGISLARSGVVPNTTVDLHRPLTSYSSSTEKVLDIRSPSAEGV